MCSLERNVPNMDIFSQKKPFRLSISELWDLPHLCRARKYFKVVLRLSGQKYCSRWDSCNPLMSNLIEFNEDKTRFLFSAPSGGSTATSPPTSSTVWSGIPSSQFRSFFGDFEQKTKSGERSRKTSTRSGEIRFGGRFETPFIISIVKAGSNSAGL